MVTGTGFGMVTGTGFGIVTGTGFGMVTGTGFGILTSIGVVSTGGIWFRGRNWYCWSICWKI